MRGTTSGLTYLTFDEITVDQLKNMADHRRAHRRHTLERDALASKGISGACHSQDWLSFAERTPKEISMRSLLAMILAALLPQCEAHFNGPIRLIYRTQKHLDYG